MSVSKSAGNLLTAIGGTVLDYAEQSGAAVSITGTIGSPTMIVSGNAVLFDGQTTVLVEAFVPDFLINSGTVDRYGVWGIYEDGTLILTAQLVPALVASRTNRVSVTASKRFTPTAGSHTYSVRGYRENAADTVQANGFASTSYIRITRESSIIGNAGIAGAQGGFAPLDGTLRIPKAHPSEAVYAIARHNTTQAVASGVAEPLEFNTDDYDPLGFHDPSTNNHRMTIPAGLGGVYVARVNIYTAALGTVLNHCLFTKNGANVPGSDIYWDIPGTNAVVSPPVALAAGDILTTSFVGGATGNISHGSATEVQSTFSIYRIGL